uniref:Uncharacterized protein n=1 Tax=Amphimedon queenslandica TaxID=400682 RepID=A0A1X7UXN7_AMPQE
MSEAQRKVYLPKLNNVKLKTALSQQNGKSVPATTKSKELLANPNAISAVPGGSDKDKFVLSKSGTTPHLVKQFSKGYKCGDQCMSYKSNGICSHAVAAA